MDDKKAPLIIGVSRSGADSSIDKRWFMSSLEMVLQNTFIGVKRCTLLDWDTVQVEFENGELLKVDVSRKEKCFDVLYEVVCALHRKREGGKLF